MADTNQCHSLGDDMNANELADALQETEPYYSTDYKLFDKAATMLRQQQAEYYSLLVNHDKLYAKVIEQQAEIEALKAELRLIDELVTGKAQEK